MIIWIFYFWGYFAYFLSHDYDKNYEQIIILVVIYLQ